MNDISFHVIITATFITPSTINTKRIIKTPQLQLKTTKMGCCLAKQRIESEDIYWRRRMLNCQGHYILEHSGIGPEDPTVHQAHVKACRNGKECPHDCDECRHIRKVRTKMPTETWTRE
jgi:hypothetical protein